MSKDRGAYLAWGRETLKTESEALQLIADEQLGETFIGACEALVNLKGRVVATGLGKSGHVARKVASTLASTGTSSFFLHPSEALHGDFGMMHKDDILLAIAYGGETTETVEVAKFARHLEIPVISITGKETCTLSSLADFAIVGKVTREADPHNLAPTASSTAAMAIGDALAVVAMRARGFTEVNFASLHPGGSLGRRLSTVADHVVSEFSKVEQTADIHTILEAITRYNHGIAAIVDDQGTLVGAISDGDIRRAFLEANGAVLGWTAENFVKGCPKTISSSALAIDAVNQMKTITQLFVVDTSNSNRLLGLVRLHDLLAAKIR